ncbi:hypothetical protein C8R42DRAFT_672954, partial [Lentinula raphanica]
MLHVLTFSCRRLARLVIMKNPSDTCKLPCPPLKYLEPSQCSPCPTSKVTHQIAFKYSASNHTNHS